MSQFAKHVLGLSAGSILALVASFSCSLPVADKAERAETEVTEAQVVRSRLSAEAAAGLFVPEYYVAPRAAAEIVLDGVLAEAAWEDAPWTELFVDIEGTAKPAPAHATRAKMLWDDEHLFVGAYLEEPHVWGTLTARDSIIYHDNDFEIFLDPDRDERNYYELEVNALGTLFDLFLNFPYNRGGRADTRMDFAGVRLAVDVEGTLNDPSDTDRGWSVEFSIPFQVFAEHSRVALPPNAGDVWKVNFSRVQWQHLVEDGAYRKVPGVREDNWVWSAQHAINMHLPERWGFLEFQGR